MARRVRRHPLEDWADLFTDDNMLDMLLEGTLMPALETGTGIDDVTHLMHAANIVFAHQLRKGTGQIVRVAEEVYDDVLASKLDDDMAQDVPLPWKVFAIEMRRDGPWQAFVTTTWHNVDVELMDALAALGCRDFETMLRYCTELTHVAKRILPDEEGRDRSGEIPIMAPIPAMSRMKELAGHAADSVVSEAARRGRVLVDGGRTLDRTDILKRMPLIPLELGWGLDKAACPTRQEMLSLAMFVLSRNTTIRTTYEPNPKLRDNPKKRRSKATIREVGFEWTEAYRAYQSAVKANKLGGHVRPHVRRGHYHRFRTGPRDAAEPTYVTHWIPPMLVGGKGKRSNSGHVVR